MESLTIQDSSAAGGLNHVPPPGGPPQLPPQMFTTAAQLLDLTDKPRRLTERASLLEQQRTNLVLQDTIERIFIEDVYADVSRGIFLVRGENVLLLGEIDLDKDDYIPEPFRKASPEEVHALTVKKNQDNKRSDKTRLAKLQALGFEAEHSGEVLF
ncbi:MAG: hypothetical protein Q9186_004597 [Xanthomendoza sp. 1 TL-2023]